MKPLIDHVERLLRLQGEVALDGVFNLVPVVFENPLVKSEHIARDTLDIVH